MLHNEVRFEHLLTMHMGCVPFLTRREAGPEGANQLPTIKRRPGQCIVSRANRDDTAIHKRHDTSLRRIEIHTRLDLR